MINAMSKFIQFGRLSACTLFLSALTCSLAGVVRLASKYFL